MKYTFAIHLSGSFRYRLDNRIVFALVFVWRLRVYTMTCPIKKRRCGKLCTTSGIASATIAQYIYSRANFHRYFPLLPHPQPIYWNHTIFACISIIENIFGSFAKHFFLCSSILRCECAIYKLKSVPLMCHLHSMSNAKKAATCKCHCSEYC